MVSMVLDDVLATLHELVAAALSAEQDTAVKDGPLLDDLDEPDAVGIGVEAATEEGEPGRGNRTRVLCNTRDTLDITCVTQSLNGDNDLRTARRRAYGLLAVVESVLPALVQELRAVWKAEVLLHTYRPLRTDQGTLAVVEFTVRIEVIGKTGEQQ